LVGWQEGYLGWKNAPRCCCETRGKYWGRLVVQIEEEMGQVVMIVVFFVWKIWCHSFGGGGGGGGYFFSEKCDATVLVVKASTVVVSGNYKNYHCMKIVLYAECGVTLSGNQEWDGHTRAWLGTITSVISTGQDYPARAVKRSKDKGHWTGPPFHRQWPVYLQIVSSKNPDR